MLPDDLGGSLGAPRSAPTTTDGPDANPRRRKGVNLVSPSLFDYEIFRTEYTEVIHKGSMADALEEDVTAAMCKKKKTSILELTQKKQKN